MKKIYNNRIRLFSTVMTKENISYEVELWMCKFKKDQRITAKTSLYVYTSTEW